MLLRTFLAILFVAAMPLLAAADNTNKAEEIIKGGPVYYVNQKGELINIFNPYDKEFADANKLDLLVNGEQAVWRNFGNKALKRVVRSHVDPEGEKQEYSVFTSVDGHGFIIIYHQYETPHGYCTFDVNYYNYREYRILANGQIERFMGQTQGYIYPPMECRHIHFFGDKPRKPVGGFELFWKKLWQ